MPHHVEIFVHRGARRTREEDGIRREFLPDRSWPGEEVIDHLEFALRWEGLDLGLLRRLLPQLDRRDLVRHLRSKPTGIYARRLWYLWERFTRSTLDIPDAAQGNYVDLLDRDEYYSGPGERSWRHRVDMNLPGTPEFSPIIRRTLALRSAESKRLAMQCQEAVAKIPPRVYERAVEYLITKETRSSYAIERETPDRRRLREFHDLLLGAARSDHLTKERLVELQRSFVDARYANAGWRADQNYVGETARLGREIVHLVGARPGDLPRLMEDYLVAARRMLASKDLDPVVAAAAIAYPFVFLHPFSDGNGRIHRLLIQHVLASRAFAPAGIVLPVSAAMLRRNTEYDATLETFSRPLLGLVEWELDAFGRMTVLNDTSDFYRYPDCTRIAEKLFEFVEDMIRLELPSEIRFLHAYDAARQSMRDIVDLPNAVADLFLRLCRQNGGRLSRAKRDMDEFVRLSDAEIAALESAIREAFGDAVGDGD